MIKIFVGTPKITPVRSSGGLYEDISMAGIRAKSLFDKELVLRRAYSYLVKRIS
jgi:hypothetical protein